MAITQVEPFVTPKFRAAFVWAFRGKPAHEDSAKKDPRFTILMLFPPKTDLSKLTKGGQEACVNLWGAKTDNIVKMPAFKTAYKKADEICNGDGEPYFPWAKGWTAIEAWSYTQPGVAGPNIDPSTNKVEILTVESDFYSGAWARAKVRPYAYDGRAKQKGFGLNFDLINVQKMADDEKFGPQRSKAEDDFQPIEASGDDFLDAG